MVSKRTAQSITNGIVDPITTNTTGQKVRSLFRKKVFSGAFENVPNRLALKAVSIPLPISTFNSLSYERLLCLVKFLNAKNQIVAEQI
ncbi:MAG TPA: hypothetical protein PK990_09840 [Salinivirgaceae bacterium]|nr:hypothetical protein [Salinivirgaceae bacterium]